MHWCNTDYWSSPQPASRSPIRHADAKVGRPSQAVDLVLSVARITALFKVLICARILARMTASGQLEFQEGFDAYGNVSNSTVVSGSPLALAFGWQAMQVDAATGLDYDKARYYDFVVGRFTSEDPLGDGLSNPYEFADNDPTNASDPSGLWTSQGMMMEFAKQYGNKGRQLLAAAVIAGVTIRSDGNRNWTNAWTYNSETKVIEIAERVGPWIIGGWDYERSDANAARQLYRALDANFSESWLSRRLENLGSHLLQGLDPDQLARSGVAPEDVAAIRRQFEENNAWLREGSNYLLNHAMDELKVAATMFVLGASVRAANNFASGLGSGPTIVTRYLGGQNGNSYRIAATRIWETRMGFSAASRNLQVHHRIPLEWANLFPRSDPNRISNLVGIPRSIHTRINNEWTAFRAAWRGRTPSQVDIMKKAIEIDRLYESAYVILR
jgi:RHS repeat-associated protein